MNLAEIWAKMPDRMAPVFVHSYHECHFCGIVQGVSGAFIRYCGCGNGFCENCVRDSNKARIKYDSTGLSCMFCDESTVTDIELMQYAMLRLKTNYPQLRTDTAAYKRKLALEYKVNRDW